MGHDVSPIGNHQLDMRSTEALARDISKRFRANVKYGHQDVICCDPDGNEVESTFELIIQGTIQHPKSDKTLTLLDEDYQLQQMLKTHGDNIYTLPCFAGSDSRYEEIDEAKRGMCYEILDQENEVTYGTIFNDTFRDFFNTFDMRWWSFCRAFTREDCDHRLWEDVNGFRLEVMTLYNNIGGTEVFYLDDQGETQHLTETMYNWKKVKTELKTHFQETTLHIPAFLKKRKILPLEEFPLAFYDDFSDLKNE